MEFKEFKEIISETIQEFKEIKNIGFIGFMGSLNLKNDLDFIITPAKNVKKGKFLKVMCNFLELLDKNVKKKGSKVIAFSYSILEEEAEYLGKRKDGDILLHIISFPDLVPPHPKVYNSILNATKIYGNSENLRKISTTKMDFEYLVLFLINCLYSHYPKELETRKIVKQVSYIIKHNNGKIGFKGKTNKQIYFDCCNFLDNRLD